MSASRLARLWRDESFQTAVIIFFIVSVVFGFWYGSRLFLNTQYPILAVASGSMSVTPDTWSNPFGPTLHTGDLIIVEGVNPQDIYAAPYNPNGRSGDILVFRLPGTDELIVHRAVEYVLSNGDVVASKTKGETVVAFITQGDANDEPGPPSLPVAGYTPIQDIIGKVVMRIPWVGHVALFMRNSNGIIVILILIMILIIIEFALPPVLGKKPANDQEKHEEKVPKPEVPTLHISTRQIPVFAFSSSPFNPLT